MEEIKSYVPSWQENSKISRRDKKLRSTESTPNSTPVLKRQQRRRKQSENNANEDFSSYSEIEIFKLASPESSPKTKARPLARRVSNIKTASADDLWQLT